MPKRRTDPIREDHIENEVVVDAYGPEERAMSWFYYLEDRITFPLPQPEQEAFLVSLHKVQDTSQRFGYGVGDFMDGQLAGYEDRTKSKGRK